MTESANKHEWHQDAADVDGALQRRLKRDMLGFTVLSVFGSLFLGHWRWTTGLLLGGLLSLLNYHWLRTSLAAIVNIAAHGGRQSFIALRYVLRYSVLMIVIAIGANFDVISIPATLVGLCAIAAAVLFEAVRQFYNTIVHREEH